MSRKQRAASAQPAVIDACCLIDLLASGQAEEILRATGHTWHVPTSVQAEIQYVRQHDPDNPGGYKNVPADLTPLVKSGILTPCQPDNAQEQARYVHYAMLFRSDGEAMCLALGECRGWIVATDDRRAINVAQRAGMTVVSCPELLKSWFDAVQPDTASVAHVLTEIQTLAQFRPNPNMRESGWWYRNISTS